MQLDVSGLDCYHNPWCEKLCPHKPTGFEGRNFLGWVSVMASHFKLGGPKNNALSRMVLRKTPEANQALLEVPYAIWGSQRHCNSGIRLNKPAVRRAAWVQEHPSDKTGDGLR